MVRKALLKNKWGFVAREPSERVSGWKMTKRSHQG